MAFFQRSHRNGHGGGFAPFTQRFRVKRGYLYRLLADGAIQDTQTLKEVAYLEDTEQIEEVWAMRAKEQAQWIGKFLIEKGVI